MPEHIKLYRRDSDIVIANLVLERERLRLALAEIMAETSGKDDDVHRIAREAYEHPMIYGGNQRD